MNANLTGTQAFGLRMPLIKEGNVENFMDSIINNYKESKPQDGDIIGVTESAVARNAGMYVSLNEVGSWLYKYNPEATHLALYCPIFSRNRFVPILRGMLTNHMLEKVTIISDYVDEVGNNINHQITGVNYKDLYESIVKSAGMEFNWVGIQDTRKFAAIIKDPNVIIINCKMHIGWSKLFELSLQDIFSEKNNWGLLGMNSAGENKIKLFPNQQYSQWFVETLQNRINTELGVNVEVMIYGDGGYKDPQSGIWEWADPVVSPGYTKGLDGSPTEIKLKYAIDNGESEEDIKHSIEENRIAGGQSLGTTPRRIVDLLGSLMDLVSGSGDKGTPVVVVRDYFKKYTD